MTDPLLDWFKSFGMQVNNNILLLCFVIVIVLVVLSATFFWIQFYFEKDDEIAELGELEFATFKYPFSINHSQQKE